jgi:hypothetical protein
VETWGDVGRMPERCTGRLGSSEKFTETQLQYQRDVGVNDAETSPVRYLTLIHANANTTPAPAIMILRRPLLNATTAVSTPKTCVRNLQHSIPMRPVPKPIPFIPDHTAFLSAIGRGLSAHATKIPSWDALFTLTSPQLKDLGVEPARSRRYLLHWREKYRNGEYGIGGDCKHVQDGVAELKVVEALVHPNPQLGNTISPRSAVTTATHDPGTRKFVANVPVGAEAPVESVETLPKVQGVILKGAKTIKGSFVEPVKGSGGLKARIRLQEGIWEVRRGHKVDGGERRKAEVRAKRRAAENKEKAR